ncbi:MAG: class I SAM-dependent methyltransferase [Pseudomonadota bacterium]
MSGADRETLDCYAEQARDYARITGGDFSAADLDRFVAALPAGDGPVLDWGAGPGHDAARLIAHGLDCEASDASPEMVALMAEKGVSGRCETFDALEPVPRYRGIWANFSLLHAEEGALAGLIERAADALLPKGVLHLGMKRGQGTRRDSLGRRYVYVEAADLDRMTGQAGLERIALAHGRSVGLSGEVADHVIHVSRKRDA